MGIAFGNEDACDTTLGFGAVSLGFCVFLLGCVNVFLAEFDDDFVFVVSSVVVIGVESLLFLVLTLVVRSVFARTLSVLVTFNLSEDLKLGYES